MATITNTLGVGSGIDTTALIEGLASGVRAPKEAALTAKETKNTAQISGLATATNAISAFSSALTSLVSGGTLYTQPTSSDSSVVTVSALSGARLSGLNAQLEVTQLAQAQSLVSGTLTNVNAEVGLGKLTIVTANGSFDVEITSANNTMIGLAQAINATGSGVTASLVEDSSGARLSLKAASGAANAFTITADPTADASLAAFAYSPSATGGMESVQTAQDAIVKLDGVSTTRSTNTFTDLIDGVTVNLQKAAVGTKITIGASTPTAAIKQAVQDVVDAFNEVFTQLSALTTKSPTSTTDTSAGALSGVAGIRDLQRRLAQIPSTILASGNSVSSLAEVGVKTNRDGTLTLDTAALDKVLESDPAGVEALFNPGQSSSDPLVKITSAYGRAKPGTYEVANLVPGNLTTNATGKIGGFEALGATSRLVASYSSPAYGLVIEPLGNVASATITVDLGIAGALKAISDDLTSSTGIISAISARLKEDTSRLAEERLKMVDQDTAYRERLTKTYTVMEQRVAASKATQSYLEQQIALWTNSDS